MELSVAYLESLFLVAMRIIAFLMIMPVFSHKAIPAIVKIGLGVVLGVVVLPMGTEVAPIADSTGLYLFAIGRELLVGVMAGFAANMVFAGIGMAGSLIGVQIGMGFDSMVGITSEDRGSPFEQLYSMLAALVFLAGNGHHQVLLGLQKLFQLVPVNTFSINDLMLSRLTQLSSGMFMVAIRMALPVVGALLLTDVALALMARIAPQMNIFFVGLPLKMVIGVVTLVLALPFLIGQVERLVGGLVGDFNMLVAAR